MNISLRTGRMLHFDSRSNRFHGDPAATAVALATIDGTEVIVYELPIVGGESTGATLVAAVDAVTCDPAFILQR